MPDLAHATSPTVARRVIPAVVVTVCLVAAAWVVSRPNELVHDIGAGLGAAAAAEPAPTTTTTRPPADLAELPVPGPLPFNAYEATPEVVLGSLQIPKIEVDQPLQEGMTLTAINRGPSHWPGTARPGEVGNVVVAGHRVTYKRSFNRLDELVPGDQVIFRMVDGGVHTYEVTSVSVVGPDDLWIADQTYAHTATLFACHPKGSARQRIVASLRLLGDDGRPVDEVTPPYSDVRRDAWTDELFVLPPDHALRPGEPPNLSAPGSLVQVRAGATPWADQLAGADPVDGARPDGDAPEGTGAASIDAFAGEPAG